jgi:hypothetical protein
MMLLLGLLFVVCRLLLTTLLRVKDGEGSWPPFVGVVTPIATATIAAAARGESGSDGGGGVAGAVGEVAGEEDDDRGKAAVPDAEEVEVLRDGI